jgi:hypothetical protein
MKNVNASQKLLLLPSSKLVPLELQIEFGAIPSGMIPLSSQPAIRYIAAPYVEQGYNVIVAVHEQAEQINRYIQNHPELQAETVDVGVTKSLGETIQRTLETLENLPQQLVINFGDTYIGDAPTGNNVIFYKNQDDVFRWTTFEKDDNGRLIQILDKNQEKSDFGSLPVFVGVFAIGDVSSFFTKLQVAVENRTSEQALDPFYAALMAYFNDLPASEKIFQEVQDWRDFGHLDTYHTTKKLFCINQRYFNQVKVDARRGIVRKSSQDVQKFIHEINWYLRLPKTIKYMAPRVFDYSLDHADPYVEMEFYGYPALNDMYMFGDCDMGVWSQVFGSIRNLVQEMRQYHLKPEGPDTLKGAMQDIYYEKTLKRLKPILDDERFAPFCGDSIRINGVACAGLRKVLDTLPDVIDAVNLYECEYFTIIHGDLCLSNILYDRANRIIRLIDPRGTFGVFDIYGDPRYDLAKLSHSIEGDYDFFSNGLFDSHWEGQDFYCRPQLDKRHERVKAIFRSRLLNDQMECYREVKLIESLLFLSMVPLHADRHASQLAFLARGLEIYTGILHQSLQRI